MTLVAIVERARARIRRLWIVASVALGVAVTCAVLAVAAVVLGQSRWLALPRIAPFLFWGLLLVVNGGILAFTRRWLRSRGTRAGIAEAIEREHVLRDGAVRGALEVGDQGELGRHASQVIASRLETFGEGLLPATRRIVRHRARALAAGAALAVVLLGAVAPWFGDGLFAVLLPVRAWTGTLLPPITFVDLPRAVMRGESLRLTIHAPRRAVVTLQQRRTGEGWRASALAVDPSTGLASTPLGPLSGDLRLVVSDGRATTDTFLVRVTDRPFVGGVAMRAIYPAYLRREAEALPVGEPARVPAGTVIEVSGHASTELRAVKLVNPAVAFALATSGRAFSGRFDAMFTGTWTWAAVGAEGPITDVPLPLELEVVPDSLPRVEIVMPASDTTVNPADRVTVRVIAADDHGLRAIELWSWRQSAGGARASVPAVVRLAEVAVDVWSGSTELDLATRGLEPGDVLHVRVSATDNSPAAQRGESHTLRLRVPSAEERRERAREAGDSAASTARAIAAAERALEQRTGEAARARDDRAAGASASSAAGANNDMSFESAEKTRALARDQRALVDQVKQLEQAARALEEQLRGAGALDSSLARQLQDAQALLREAITPELLAQMQKVESASQQLSRAETQTTLRELQEMQRRLREQLERSAEMLKRAALEGTMQTLSDEARELAARQRQLADSARARGPMDSTSRSGASPDATRQLADRTGRLTSNLQRLEDRLSKDRAVAGAARTGDARDHADSSRAQLAASMRAGSATGAGAPPQGGRTPLDSAAAEMQRAANAMQDARGAQIAEWKRELTAELDRAVQEMLQLSREEAAMEQKARDGAPDDLRSRQSAVKQGLDQAARRLEVEAQKTTLLSGRSQRAVAEAQQKVDQVTQQVARQQGPESAAAMRDAGEALNRAAASLARDRERANSTRSATGFEEMMQQLQELANKQGSINSQAQGLMPGAGVQPTLAMQQAARALARQQRQVAQQLDELGDAAGGDRAARLAQEARQLAEALEGGRIDAATLSRQQQLFRRMLDAGRSLEKEEREESDRREARAGGSVTPFDNRNTDAKGAAATRFREPTWDELRGLTADERRAILEYFRRINGGKGGG